MKTIRIQFRVDKIQHERILNLARAKGFYSVADFLRYTVLEKDLSLERKFEEVHEAIMKLAETKK